jgi:hypothetical protein
MEDASPEKKTVPVSGGADTSVSSGTAKVHDVDVAKRAKTLGLPFFSDASKKWRRRPFSFVPEDTAREYRMAVFEKKGDVIRIAMVDPEDFEALNVLRFLAEKEQLNIEIHLAASETVEALLKQYSGTDRALKDAISSLKKDAIVRGIARERTIHESRPRRLTRK